jgi:hypothetical protein
VAERTPNSAGGVPATSIRRHREQCPVTRRALSLRHRVRAVSARDLVFPVVVTLLVLVTALLSQSPLRDAATHGDVTGMRIAVTPAFVLLSPFCSLLDMQALLTVPQHIALLITLLVGANQASFYEQQAAANLNIPMGSSVNVGQAYEHKRFKPPALKDMYVTANYIEEIDSPASNDFKKRFRAKFPDAPYINQEAANAYNVVYLYKAAAEKAKSTDMKAVRKALESGDICTDGPSGKVCIDPKSHHQSHTIYLVQVKADHSVVIPKVWNDIKPYWLGEAGCDLSKKDDTSQYTPSNPPKK